MEWAFVSVLGFLAATALVIALARSNTARWEAHHRAAQAAIRAREEASLRARAAALLAQRAPGAVRHLPHPHVPHLHLPHVHLPARIVERLPHPHLPRLDGHLLHLDGRFARLAHLPGRRRRTDGEPARPDGVVPARPDGEVPARPDGEVVGRPDGNEPRGTAEETSTGASS
ncbi:hypothetical protein ACI79C_23245 [Geodermatophilus sp. SYSU D00697]